MKLEDHWLWLAKAELKRTETPDNKCRRDPTITPFMVGMKLAGFTSVTKQSGCASLQPCGKCREPYAGQYTKDDVEYIGCPFCNTVTPL